MRELSVDIGPRVAGTASEIEARDYIKSTLESYGYDVTLQDFSFDATKFLPVRIDAGDVSVAGLALAGSPAGTATGRLIDAGQGAAEDYPPGGAAGAIALVDRGGLTFDMKVQNAVAAGAAGLIVANNEAGSAIFALENPAKVPAVGVTQAVGEQLKVLAATGTVQATITVSPPRGTAWNVIAMPKDATSCATITGGHYDSVAVAPGADDNASGTASVLELARVVAAMGLKTAHCFALFSGEEIGLIGSSAYIDSLPQEERDGLSVMVNLDVVGLDEGLTLIGDEDVIDVARIEADKIGIDASSATLPRGSGSDHLSFQRAGIPVVMLYRADSMIHTPTDNIERIIPERLAETVRVALATLKAREPE